MFYNIFFKESPYLCSVIKDKRLKDNKNEGSSKRGDY
jgi:hypothetical protein